MADILQASSSTLAQLPSPSSSHLPTPLSSLLLSHSHTAVSVLLFVANLALQCWHLFRTWVLIPIVQLSVYACLVMSIMLVIEKVFMGAVSLYDKVFQRRPERMYKWRPMGDRDDDPEKGNLEYPMVLVQVPMFNEKEVYQLSIGAACNLSWPAERVIIQVLDDSTDPVVKELVASECRMWAAKGKNIRYERRSNRDGYKAGALKKGMKYDYVSKCDYVAIFDADFQPDPDFLLRTIPFLVCNTDIALVQARWKFVNANECLMTRIQEMSMDYHFKVEQESGSSTHAFFGFNGTAGVWRIHALEEAGGWKDRTTVEDMDLAVRAFLGGWKFVYIGDIKVKSELPSTFKAYRNQQHRWSCGPANLLRKMAWEIITNKKVAVYKKFYVIYNFFVARRIVAHIVTFFLYCIVIPTSVFFPEVYIPKWVIVYVPTTITLLNSVGTPSSFHLILFWILFENVMAMHRSKAVLIGLFEAGRVNEWVVTEKLGDTMTKPKVVATINANGNDIEAPLLLPAPPPDKKKKKKKNLLDGLNLLELSLSAYLFVCATWDLLYAHNRYYIYVYPQSVTFLMMGVGYVGTFV